MTLLRRADFHEPISDEVINQMVDLALIEPQHDILVPCCGDGDLVIRAAQHGRTVTAIDMNQKVVVGWLPPHGLPNVKAVLADFLTFHLAYGGRALPTFDRVIIDTPLERNSAPYITQGLRFLKPGGRMVCLAKRQVITGVYVPWHNGVIHRPRGAMANSDFVIVAGLA